MISPLLLKVPLQTHKTVLPQPICTLESPEDSIPCSTQRLWWVCVVCSWVSKWTSQFLSSLEIPKNLSLPQTDQVLWHSSQWQRLCVPTRTLPKMKEKLSCFATRCELPSSHSTWISAWFFSKDICSRAFFSRMRIQISVSHMLLLPRSHSEWSQLFIKDSFLKWCNG